MFKVTLFLVAAAAFAGCANSPLAKTEVPGLIDRCNIAADSSSHEARALRACDTLAKHGLLSLAEPDAALAYSTYQQDLKRWQACETLEAIADSGAAWQDPQHASSCPKQQLP